MPKRHFQNDKPIHYQHMVASWLPALALAFSSGCATTSGAQPASGAGVPSAGGDPAVASAQAELLAELASGDAVLQIFPETMVLRVADRPAVTLRLPVLNDAPSGGVRLLESGPQSLVLEVQYPASVDFHKSAGDDAARLAALQITAVDGGFRLQSKPEWGRRTTLELEHDGQHYFGASEGLHPDNRLSPDLSGRSVRIEVASEGNRSRRTTPLRSLHFS